MVEYSPAALPSSPTSERAILASLLVDHSLVARACSRLALDDFTDKEAREVFRAVSVLQGIGAPVDSATIYEDLIARGAEGLATYELLENTVTCGTATFDQHVDRILDLSARRKVMEHAQTIALQAQSESIHIDDLRKSAKAIAESLKTKSRDAASRVYIPSPDNRPEDPGPLVELKNVRMLSAGGVCMVSALAGSGKSSVLEAGLSTVVQSFGPDALGLRFNAKTVLYIDTERSQLETHISRDRFLRRCELQPHDHTPACVRWENLRGISDLSARLEYLDETLSAKNLPEIIIIDGIGDFVSDPNDSDSCTSIVSKLSACAHERQAGIIVTLHINPSDKTTKARGVLGSELWRKAESVLIIEKLKDGIRRLTTDYSLGKNRGGSDEVGAYFKWSDDLKMHISCDGPGEDGDAASNKVLKARKRIIEMMENRSFTHTELKSEIVKLGCCEKTAKNRISELLNDVKLIVKDEFSGLYSVSGSVPAPAVDDWRNK